MEGEGERNPDLSRTRVRDAQTEYPGVQRSKLLNTVVFFFLSLHSCRTIKVFFQ